MRCKFNRHGSPFQPAGHALHNCCKAGRVIRNIEEIATAKMDLPHVDKRPQHRPSRRRQFMA